VSHHTQQASENEDEKHVQNAFYLDVAANASALNLGLITKSFSTPTGFINIYPVFRQKSTKRNFRAAEFTNARLLRVSRPYSKAETTDLAGKSEGE
jgi:hypothetical protein